MVIAIHLEKEKKDMFCYLDNDQLVEKSVLKGWNGKLPRVLNIKDGVKTVLGEKDIYDLKENRFGNDIFYNAFNQNDILEEIIMPDTVTKIGEKAFEHAHALDKVTISPNVSQIMMSAFLGCCSLKHISLPKSLKLLDTWCFDLIEDLVIDYDGTIEEFNKIKKGDEWCNNGTKIICKDGVIIYENI